MCMSEYPTDTATDAPADAGAGSHGVQDAAREAAGHAADQAREAAGRLGERARAEADRRSTEAGERLGQTAGDLRTVADELRAKGKDTPARVADQVAGRAERLAGYLRESDPERILHDLEDYGRRQPWVVVTAGVALGFLAARFLKASSGERYESRRRAGTLQPYRAQGNGGDGGQWSAPAAEGGDGQELGLPPAGESVGASIPRQSEGSP
jgi:hypothetical protein